MAAKDVNMSKLSTVLLPILCCLIKITSGQTNTGSGTNTAETTDVSLCPCDLTGNSCDVNCCCDPDCSDADKLVFSSCLSNSYTEDDKLCFDRDVFFSENGPTRSGDSGSLFCIYFDNDEDRNFYNTPVLITSEEEFLQNSAKTRTFSFQSSENPLTVSSFEPYYKTTTCGRFLANLANCGNAEFLRASTFFQDFRIVKDPFLLQAFNSTTTAVDSIFGSVDLTEVTELYNNSYTAAIELEPVDPLLCIQNNLVGPCGFSSVPAAPTYDAIAATCTNTLVGVNYRFETNGAFGVDRAFVRFTFADVTSASLTQTFSTSFSSITTSSTAEPVERSGNPGYDVGLPVIAGVFNTTNDGGSTIEEILLIRERGQQLALVRPSATGACDLTAAQPREPVLFGEDMRTGCFIDEEILLIRERGQQLALVRPSATGACDLTAAQPREPVLFGEDMRSGCFIEINERDNCLLVQQQIIRAVEGYAVPSFDPALPGYPKNNRYVAVFGNSDIRKLGDWVEILYRGRPGNDVFQGSDCKLSLGANIQILYANIGALANPQAKILGISYVYDASQTILYQCTGALCQPGQSSLTRRLEISTSVTFIDVSDPPVGVEGQYPTVPARLPYDFFYPFTDAAPKQCKLSLNLVALCAFIVLFVWVRLT
ncbi:tectonic-like protein [Plakobranchus ocellatus]|uniref:Tectonic-like protein n=1 Tax=Plakobranchus ocellatus TaxID=259542 RepID=A0AAV3ZJV1_9GAST|nr:tectonic-like protein [Plakobranchus ocellatus]